MKRLFPLFALLFVVQAHAQTCVKTDPNTQAVVRWVPPTLNKDGTTLTDLAGYQIQFGIGNFFTTVTVKAPASCALITGLTKGDWQFQVLAFNTAGMLSAPSNSAVLQTHFAGPTNGAIEHPGTNRVIPKK